MARLTPARKRVAAAGSAGGGAASLPIVHLSRSREVRYLAIRKERIAVRRLFIASLLFALVVAPAGALAQDGFDYFVGHWRCEGVFPKSGRSIASTLRFERDAGSGALKAS